MELAYTFFAFFQETVHHNNPDILHQLFIAFFQETVHHNNPAFFHLLVENQYFLRAFKVNKINKRIAKTTDNNKNLKPSENGNGWYSLN